MDTNIILKLLEKNISTKALSGYVDGETLISKYLKAKDFTSSATANSYHVDNRLPLNLLQDAKNIALIYDKIYDQFGGNIKLSSGYRSPRLNALVKGSPSSQHKFAQALDIQGINGVKNMQILQWVLKNITFNQCIHEYGTQLEPKWVHIGYGTKMQFLKIGVK